MPKIRSIKPESCISDQLADVSLLAALAFAYLPCFCDDEGRMVCSARRIKAQLFPMRADVSVDDCGRAIDELEAAGLVRTYEASGRLYLHVTGFARHQRPTRPKPSVLPAPPGEAGAGDGGGDAAEGTGSEEPGAAPGQGDDGGTAGPEQRASSDGAVPQHCTSSDEAVPEQCSNSNGSGSGSGKGKGKGKGARARDGDREAVERVVARLNERAGTSFRATTKATASAIRARLREGYTVEQMLAVIDAKAAEWMPVPDMRRHLCPETLFRPSKFEKYVQALGTSPSRKGASYAAYD